MRQQQQQQQQPFLLRASVVILLILGGIGSLLPQHQEPNWISQLGSSHHHNASSSIRTRGGIILAPAAATSADIHVRNGTSAQPQDLAFTIENSCDENWTEEVITLVRGDNSGNPTTSTLMNNVSLSLVRNSTAAAVVGDSAAEESGPHPLPPATCVTKWDMNAEENRVHIIIEKEDKSLLSTMDENAATDDGNLIPVTAEERVNPDDASTRSLTQQFTVQLSKLTQRNSFGERTLRSADRRFESMAGGVRRRLIKQLPLQGGWRLELHA